MSTLGDIVKKRECDTISVSGYGKEEEGKMKITALVENESHCELVPKHGLSLYVETERHKLLFDVGPKGVLVENAHRRGIDLASVDTVILSHGHYDHTGGLKEFLEENHHAKIYVRKSAFRRHFVKTGTGFYDIGLSKEWETHPQLLLLDGDTRIDEELLLFAPKGKDETFSPENASLFEEDAPDCFEHEQNLIIREKKTALLMGCGHMGVANIMRCGAVFSPDLCIGGFHLFNPAQGTTVPRELLDRIAAELRHYPTTDFYTCHCTGREAFEYLAAQMPNLRYLSCGENITAG